MSRRNPLEKHQCPACGRAYYYNRHGVMVARRGIEGPPGRCCQAVLPARSLNAASYGLSRTGSGPREALAAAIPAAPGVAAVDRARDREPDRDRTRTREREEFGLREFAKAILNQSLKEEDFGELVTRRPCFPVGGDKKDYPHFTIGLTSGLAWNEGDHYDLIPVNNDVLIAKGHPAGRYHIQVGRAARLKVRLPRHCNHVRVYYRKETNTYTCLLLDTAPEASVSPVGKETPAVAAAGR
ncbi:MAG: hypothetical protein HY719_06035 [Planctomycetes bacterium]|nr:hypothetical protein [Planctomycetota bacterium]